MEEIDDFDAFFENEDGDADPESTVDPPFHEVNKSALGDGHRDMKTLAVPNLPVKPDPSESILLFMKGAPNKLIEVRQR